MTDQSNYQQALVHMASTLKKGNKAHAHERLKWVIAEVGEVDADLAAKLGPDLAALYAFFLPPTPAKPKSAWHWVAKAMGVRDIRPYLNFVYVTEEWITATDGHRLHRAPNTDGIAPGYYNKAGDKVHESDWARYPDVERIIPPTHALKHDVEAPESGTIVGEGKGHVKTAYNVSGEDTRFYANRPYMQEAVSFGDADQVRVGGPHRSVDVRKESPEFKSPARFDFADGRIAVVMPMRD